jgi:hypothetical protein
VNVSGPGIMAAHQGCLATARRWVLLAVLAFALVGMHSLVTLDAAPPCDHVVGTPALATEVMSAPAPGAPASGHGDHQHLCLAVLVGLVVLALGWLSWRRGRHAAGHATSRPEPSMAGRGPPRGPPTARRLSTLCVLRL